MLKRANSGCILVLSFRIEGMNLSCTGPPSDPVFVGFSVEKDWEASKPLKDVSGVLGKTGMSVKVLWLGANTSFGCERAADLRLQVMRRQRTTPGLFYSSFTPLQVAVPLLNVYKRLMNAWLHFDSAENKS